MSNNLTIHQHNVNRCVDFPKNISYYNNAKINNVFVIIVAHKTPLSVCSNVAIPFLTYIPSSHYNIVIFAPAWCCNCIKKDIV